MKTFQIEYGDLLITVEATNATIAKRDFVDVNGHCVPMHLWHLVKVTEVITEATPAGNQFVIPGCEKRQAPNTTQLELLI